MNFCMKNVPEDVVNKIDVLAKERGLSRNNFIILLLTNVANEDVTNKLDNKYNYLVNILKDTLEFNTETLERNNKLIERILSNGK